MSPVGFSMVWAERVRQNKFPALKYIINVKDKKHSSFLLFSLS